MDKFEKKYAAYKDRMRKNTLAEAMDKIQEWVKQGKIISMSFTTNKEDFLEEEEEIIVDYSVDLSDGRNIADLSLDSFEDAILDFVETMEERKDG